MEVLVSFAILGCDAHLEWIFAEIYWRQPRQPAYEIKLMLSRVSWALAQISCLFLLCTLSVCLSCLLPYGEWRLL